MARKNSLGLLLVFVPITLIAVACGSTSPAPLRTPPAAGGPRRADGGRGLGEPLQLDIANSVWGQPDYDFASAYLDTLALYYGAGIRLVSFAEDPEGSRRAINEWVSDQTQERIPELIPEGVIDEMTRLVPR